MAASGSGPSAGEGFPAAARLAGFVRRTLVATLGGFFFVALLVRGDGLPTGQGAGRHPLGEALDAAGAAILATEVVAWAEVSAPVPPTMRELKEWAGRLVPSGSAGVELSSVAEEGYRAVYFQGEDRRGGIWTASARWIAGSAGIELSFHRYVYGPVGDLGREVHAARSLLERAAGGPLPGASAKVRLEARPAEEGDAALLAAGIVAGAGASLRLISVQGERVVAKGYTPRLAGGVDDAAAGKVNLEVAIAPRGRAQWIEVGWPRL